MSTDLHATVSAILNQLLGKPPTVKLELDRVHRVQRPRPSPSTSAASAVPPRDILCRVHFYTEEETLRQAWSKGSIDFDGTTIRVYPDVTRQTRTMRGMLHPLLEVIQETEATYRWGHPFHLLSVNRGWSFFYAPLSSSQHCLTCWISPLSRSPTG